MQDGVVEEHSVLRNDSNNFPHALLRVQLDVLSVEKHAARDRVVKPKEQPRYGGLPSSGMSDDGGGGPGWHNEVDILETFRLVL